MYDKLSDCARKAMELANGQTEQHGHNYLGTEHILLGVAEGEQKAGGTLAKLGLDYLDVSDAFDRVAVSAGGQAREPAKKTLEYAYEEMLAAGRTFVSVDDLLLGVFKEETQGYRVLRLLGISEKCLRLAMDGKLAVKKLGAGGLYFELKHDEYHADAQDAACAILTARVGAGTIIAIGKPLL